MFSLLCLLLAAAELSAQVLPRPGPADPAKHLVPPAGQFPSAETPHPIRGELIQVDHVNRSAVLRPDRTDDQGRAYIDRALPLQLLPYGAVWFHGAPASLKDIPLGIHLHGEFFFDESRQRDPKLRDQVEPRRVLHPYFPYYWVLQLEDDFSRAARTGQFWKVAALDRNAGKLTVVAAGQTGEEETGKPVVFDLLASTRVWKGRAIGTLDDVAAGQIVVANLSACTLHGPGQVADLWLDAESRALATAHQLSVHRLHLRRRGFPGRVDAVDNQQRLVTVTLFAGFDPSLDLEALFGPVSATTAVPQVSGVVANDALRSYDQQNIKKTGPLISMHRVPIAPGSSGLQLTFQPADLLEGFRPNRIVRMFPEAWKVEDLPKEEELKR